MPRLIDADALLKHMYRSGESDRTGSIVDVRDIEDAPTIHAEPIVYGKIVVKGDGWTHWYACSECGNQVDLGDKRCRNCPAQFKEEKGNG